MTRCEDLTMEQMEFLDKCLKFMHTMERKRTSAVHFGGEVKTCSKE